MLTFHVLSALAAELDEAFRGRRCVDAFSQARDELTLAFVDPEDDVRTLRIGAGGFRFVFESASLGRARKNVATLFEPAFGRDVAQVEVAERDRMLFVRFTDGSYFQIVLFGPRPNVLLVDAAGTIEEPFLHTGDLVGQSPPAPRPAPVVETFEQFESRWPANRKTVSSALSRVMPLFDAQTAREAAFRAEVPADEPPGSVEESQRQRLFEASQALSQALADPSPVMYWRGALAEGFGLVPMQHLEAREELRAEPFDSVGKALGVYARRRLAQVRFQAMYQPMEAALARAAGRLERRAEGMLDALAQESRAGRYERWGHLLMAAPDAGQPARSDTITLPDIFEAGPDITIPLDERLTLVENAQRYYAKAKTTRDARAHAEERLDAVGAQAEEAARLLEQLRSITRKPDLEAFAKAHKSDLARIAGGGAVGEEQLPFRRYEVEGYTVLVGRNAKENDALTLKHAQKHDLWFHARDVPGSHVVLRRPGPTSQPSRHALETVASIAAHYSGARHAGLAPVQYTERKYVVKPRGVPAGAVRLLREDVLLVEPRLP